MGGVKLSRGTMLHGVCVCGAVACTEVPGCAVYMSTVVAKVTANTNVC